MNTTFLSQNPREKRVPEKLTHKLGYSSFFLLLLPPWCGETEVALDNTFNLLASCVTWSFITALKKIAPLFLSHLNPLHVLPPSFLKNYLNINFPPTPVYSKSSVHTRTLHAFLWSQKRDACVAHFSSLSFSS